MFRRYLPWFAAAALLVQGLSLAWAQPMQSAHSAAPSAQKASAELPPCHAGAESKPATSGKQVKTSACCAESCSCPDLCAASAPGLPAQSAELDDYINAHFDALRDTEGQSPAHAFTPLRPPAAPHS